MMELVIFNLLQHPVASFLVDFHKIAKSDY